MQKMIDYTKIADHIVKSCSNHPVSVVETLCSHYNCTGITCINNGYCVYEDTSVSFPSVFLNEHPVTDINEGMLWWKILLHSKPISTAFLFILSTKNRPVCRATPILSALYEYSDSIVTVSPYISNALRAGRTDLQLVVSQSSYYLLSVLGSKEKITNFIEFGISTPWKVNTGTTFWADLKFACHNAAIVTKEVLPDVPCTIIADNSGRILMCERDQVVLLFVLLFSSKFDFVSKTKEVLLARGVPVQLACVLMSRFPRVFNKDSVWCPSHFR